MLHLRGCLNTIQIATLEKRALMIRTNRFGMCGATILLAASSPLFSATAQPPSGSSPATFDRTACVLDAGDSVVMTESGGSDVYELRGKKGAPFKNYIGKQTHIVGQVDTTATPKPGAVKAAKGGTVRVVTVAGMKAGGAGACNDLATALGVSAAAGAGAAAAAGAASAASVAAAAGAATAAGIAVPAAAAVSTAAIAGAAAAGAAAAGVGAAAGAGAIGGGTTSPATPQ
jgi:hypothetical protein